MSLHLLEIHIRNFQSVGNITQIVKLSNQGLTLILGENLDIGGEHSKNGVGKSTLIQAISYALYGEPLVKIKQDNLINNQNNKNLYVKIIFESHGKTYIIERGRSPRILKFIIDGKDIGKENEAKGVNAITQIDIDKVLGLTHTMFKHIVALNTYTEPFMKLKSAEQREVIEELLGIAQLSERADILKKIRDETKDSIKIESVKINANTEANDRISQAIDKAKKEAEYWQQNQDEVIENLVAKIASLSNINIEKELSIFDNIDDWTKQKNEVDELTVYARKEIISCNTEISRITKEIQRYKEEASKTDSGELWRLNTQLQRYISETKSDITPQINRLLTEASRKRQDAENKKISIDRLYTDKDDIQNQIDFPSNHTCTTCGQGLEGTDHLSKILDNLKKKKQSIISEIDKSISYIDDRNKEADSIGIEIENTKKSDDDKKKELENKISAIKNDIENSKKELEQQKKSSEERVVELSDMLSSINEKLKENTAIIDEADFVLESLGSKPVSKYPNKDAVLKIQKDRDMLSDKIKVEREKQNVHLSKIEGLESTIIEIDYTNINDYNHKLKHEDFLYKLLTDKNSFIRKKIVDLNLLYLNNRMNHYLEQIGLPHEVAFKPDLTVEVLLMGRELDFDQLSRGEQNRVIMATFWAFRDVWQNLNHTINFMACDEILDQGTDYAGVEAAVDVLKKMAVERKMNIFLISHREELRQQIDNILIVRKENGFTSINLEN